ncbi:MAG: hypothetical protein IPO21_08675 [Bacteroidales bacterium]|nr:hypothetical protein [Bacteroidales bacterium]
MKKLLYLPIIMLLLFSCENYEEQVNQLKSTNDSLARVNVNRDSSINQFLASFNEIEANLAQIKEKENLLSVENMSGVENNESKKEKINQDILQIYELLQSNKQKLAQLQKNLNRSDIKISELNKTIKNLQNELIAKDSALVILRETLKSKDLLIDSLYKNIDSMYNTVTERETVISSQKDEMNTAYYAVGTKKELIANQILDKKGGFVGINKVLQLKNDFNKEYFTKVDITKFNSLPIMSKKASVITSHQTSTYSLIKATPEKIDSLSITNPKEFWATSKYLVIVIE